MKTVTEPLVIKLIRCLPVRGGEKEGRTDGVVSIVCESGVRFLAGWVVKPVGMIGLKRD